MYGFGDYYDGYGIDAAHGVTPPPAPKRAAVPFNVPLMNPATGRPVRAGDQMPSVDLWPKTPAATPVNYAPQMAAWKQNMRTALTRPAVSSRPFTSSRPSSARSPSAGVTGSTPEQAQTAQSEQPQVAQHQQPESGEPSMFQQHFGHHNDMVKGVNDAMSDAAKQWSDAAQFDQSRQHQMALQNNALQAGLQMKQMEMNRDAQKYNVLGGLLRSATGNSGFRIDGQGNYSNL
jgi:hypothetical protein